MAATRVTLTTSNTAYNLYTLVSAVNTSFALYGHQLTLQADIGNGGVVYIGDSTLSTTKYGASLTATGAANYVAPFNGLGLEQVYLLGSVNGQLVDVTSLVL